MKALVTFTGGVKLRNMTKPERVRSANERAARAGALVLVAHTKPQVNRRTGNAARSIQLGPVNIRGSYVTQFYGSRNPVITYLDKGTGIYGERGKLIRPTQAKALRIPIGNWKSARSVNDVSVQGLLPRGKQSVQGVIFRKSSRGIKPQNIFTKGIMSGRRESYEKAGAIYIRALTGT